jgi:hypothetical protein
MTIQHSTITGADLHEPKGVATAANKTVYVANGSASGAWTAHNAAATVYIAFNSASPTYTQANTTSDVILDPAWVSGVVSGFTVQTSPNARIRYDGTDTKNVTITLATACNQASGSNKDVEFALFKNGTELAGSRSVRTTTTGDWGSITVIGSTTMATNDYIEVKTKASAAATIQYASLSMSVLGVV